MTRAVRFAFSSTAWILSTAIASAAAPDVTSLFPAGASQGSSTRVSFQGKFGDGTTDVWCSRPGIKVTIPEKKDHLQIDAAADAQPGLYWIRFFNGEGTSSLRPFVVGMTPEMTEVEPNDDPVKAQSGIQLPVVINGQHGKAGDSDSFAVALKRGQVLVASMTANRILGSPQDAVLQILGPDGFVLEQNEDDQGFDPKLVFTAPADGIYKLRTWAFPATPDSSIRLFGSPACVYRLQLTTGPSVDHVVPAAVQAGTSQHLRAQGWNLSSNAFFIDAPVSVLQRRFEYPPDRYLNPLPIMVVVEPHSVALEQEPNDQKHPQAVSLPISITGQIAVPKDVDAFQFEGKKDQRLRFEVTAREMGSPLDPVLRLSDSNGKVLKEADDDGKQSVDPDIEFTLPADGVYQAAISDRFLHCGDRFVYLLAITEPVPDVTLSVAADSFTLKPGTDLEIPVTIHRTFGFSEALRIGIHGLPPEVSCEPVESEGKGDTSKSIKLKLKTNGSGSFSGPIRIWGRLKDWSGLERIATFPIKSAASQTADLWLTVVAAK